MLISFWTGYGNKAHLLLRELLDLHGSKEYEEDVREEALVLLVELYLLQKGC